MEDLSPEDARFIYNDIKHRVKKLYDKRKEVASHFIPFVFFMIFVWFVWLSPAELIDRSGWGIIMGLVSAGWTAGLLVHIVQWLFEEFEERAVRRELERSGIGGYTRMLQEKAKRGERLVRLSDDGELEDVTFYDDEAGQSESRRTNSG
jgi:hypothetical protein